MVTKTVTVKNKTGLHARPAAAFAAAAAEFKSEIRAKNVDKDSAELNAKSTVRMLTLGICQGMQVQITASGEDEQQAVNALVALVEEGFGEL